MLDLPCHTKYISNVSLLYLGGISPSVYPLVGLRGGWRTLLTNHKTSIMADNKRARRTLSDSEGEEDSPCPGPNIFPRFFVIQSTDESKPVSELSPFIIEKQIFSILGTPKSVKKTKDGNLLIEVFSKQQSENLLKHKSFFGKPVHIYAHSSLNQSKGIIRCKDLSYCESVDEIKTNLAGQGVVDVKRISIKKNGQTIKTNTYVLTFGTPILPKVIKVAYQVIKVEVYIPNPLRCFQCQRFGHHESKCRADPACNRCGHRGEDHSEFNCKAEIKCANCGLDHMAYSKECHYWTKEKEILTIKYKENLTFPEARKMYDQRHLQPKPTTYAKVVTPTPTHSECQSCKFLLEKLSKLLPNDADLSDLLNKSDSANPKNPPPPQTPTTSTNEQPPNKNKQTSGPVRQSVQNKSALSVSQDKISTKSNVQAKPSVETSHGSSVKKSPAKTSQKPSVNLNSQNGKESEMGVKSRPRKPHTKPDQQPGSSFTNKNSKSRSQSRDRNRYQPLEDEMETESPSSQATFGYPKDEWSENPESWSGSRAETTIILSGNHE